MRREMRFYLCENGALIEQLRTIIANFRSKCYGEKPTKIVMCCETYCKLFEEDRKYCLYTINNSTIVEKIFDIDVEINDMLPVNQVILLKEEDIVNINRDYGFNHWGVNPLWFRETEKLPKNYIINKGATILFWEDGSKTVVKRGKDDEYNKVLGFLWAYFQKTSGLSRTKANKYLAGLIDEE